MKLWGGRFQKPTDKLVEQFTSSLPFDRRLYAHDIKGSLAHASMLARCGIITEEEAEIVSEGLNQIYRDIESNQFKFDTSDEDIHLTIERTLIERIGPAAGKLHTARSRNDQVSLDLRVYQKEEMKALAFLVTVLQNTLLSLSVKHLKVVMPGYTHLQRAQPVLFSHHLMAYFFMLQRDLERLQGCYQRTDVMPLGAAALAGTSFPVDRQFVADQLGFSRVSENSMDTVSDRDFVIEFLSVAALLMTHLSRLAEELILWSSVEFGFIELDDSYTTGSSIMPQKKNPDVAELVRAKTARLWAHLFALAGTLKALPLSYNRDLQEDKESLFGAVDTLKISLQLLSGMLETMIINKERMEEATRTFLNATDAADYLVRKGLPFRQAHETVGRLVKTCLQRSIFLEDLSLEEFQSASHLFDEQIFETLKIVNCIENKISEGGTSTKSVKGQMTKAKKYLRGNGKWLENLK
jgi:argininosuccinate lyase